jgi:multiple sugar transport system permease protein
MTGIGSKSRDMKKDRKGMSDSLYSSLLVAPAMIVLLFFGLFPLFYAINMAFHNVDMGTVSGVGAYVGLDNFRYALNNEDFWASSGRTLFFAVVSVSIQMLLGISMAFLINSLKWWKGIVRSLF